MIGKVSPLYLVTLVKATLLVANGIAFAQTADYVPLKEVVASLDGGYTVLMGGASKDNFFDDGEYDELLCTNMALLAAANGCKWHYTLDDEPPYRRCDAAREFAKKCGMEFRHHTLIWGVESSNPDWLQPNSPEYGNWTADEKRQIMIDHITETMTRYKGQTKYYDVVNEAVCNCIWRDSKLTTCEEYMATENGVEKCGWSERYQTYLSKNVFWPDVEDYISLSFNIAHEIDPDALLGLNEYKFESVSGYVNGGFLKEKGICMYNLTKALKDEGVPINYVGSQTHIDLSYYTDFEGYIDSLKEYSQTFVQDLGVEWHFTETTVGAFEESKLASRDKIVKHIHNDCAVDWDPCNDNDGCCSDDFECYRR